MITRIYCSRSKQPHPLGGISADVDGLLLTYLTAVLTAPNDPKGVKSPQDGYHYLRGGADKEMRRPRDEILGIDLWCALFDAAERRQPNVTLTSRGAWDGLWK